MQAIEGKFRSLYLRDTYSLVSGAIKLSNNDDKKNWSRNDATVSKIRLSKGYPIKSFRELVEEIAITTISNKNYEMFYRGQNIDYLDKNGKTVIYPSICRPEMNDKGRYKASIRHERIIERYEDLNKLTKAMRTSKTQLDEFYFSLFQHYDILPTPLIDITQSLRVAATFALKDTKDGYLYVFGLPYPHGSISYFIDQQIVLVKLQNVSPVKALRPRYQEGYLVGKIPIRSTKECGDNLARRLVAKFHLINDNDSFWDENFKEMPCEVLFPSDDSYVNDLLNLKKECKIVAKKA